MHPTTSKLIIKSARKTIVYRGNNSRSSVCMCVCVVDALVGLLMNLCAGTTAYSQCVHAGRIGVYMRLALCIPIIKSNGAVWIICALPAALGIKLIAADAIYARVYMLYVRYRVCTCIEHYRYSTAAFGVITAKTHVPSACYIHIHTQIGFIAISTVHCHFVLLL